MKRSVSIIIGLVVIAAAVGIGFKFASFQPKTTVVTVSRGTLTEEVAVTGKTRFKTSYKLNADRGARISKMNVAVGEEVEKNQVVIETGSTRLSLRSPVKGTVVKIDTRVGEMVAPNAPLMQIVESGEKEIETFVSEADISQVKMNNPVNIAYDAFPDETFKGTVSKIDWVETMLDGVVHYRIIVEPAEDDERILSGFSANLSIVTNEEKNILLVPEYLMTERDGKVFIQRYRDRKTIEQEIEIGKRDQYGNVEVIKGLQEGDQVAHTTVKK